MENREAQRGLAELVALLDPDAIEDREELDLAVNRQVSREILLEVLDQIEKCVVRTGVDSRRLADLFWEEQNEQFTSGEPGLLGQRIRYRDSGNLEISYFRNGFTLKNNRAEKTGFKAKHVSRSGRHAYLARDLSFARKWEREMAAEYEPRHAKNRRIYEALSRARKSIRAAIKEIEDDL